MTKYRKVDECDKIQGNMLPPALRQYLETILPLYREVDRRFPPPDSNLPDGSVPPLPPECFIPTMTWYEDENDGSDNIKTDGRTIDGVEIRYQKGLWHHIFYEERSYKVYKHYKHKKLNDLLYEELKKFIFIRADDLLNQNSKLRKTYNALDDKTAKLTFYNFKYPYNYQVASSKYNLAIEMMTAVKPEWTNRLKEQGQEVKKQK